jgi:integrase
MSKPVFFSIYAPYIEQLIKFKQKLGYKYESAQELLRRFDRFAMNINEANIAITKELSEEWCKKRETESEKYRQGRINILIQLATFLNDMGIHSYVPVLPKVHTHQSYIPHIYSGKEIDAIFNACDGLRISRRLMNSYIIVLPALFRLLYSTGLRINEALSLLDSDVDLNGKYLTVRNSKNGKERIIPMSESLVTVCLEYMKYRDRMPAGKLTNYFFVSLNGKKCKSGAVYEWFRKILFNAGITYIGNNHGPRIHDLRHTFAVHSLAAMAESGTDLYHALPYLSTYLGHQSIKATNDYVRLTAEMYPDLLKNVNMICLNVFPEIKYHEAD